MSLTLESIYARCSHEAGGCNLWTAGVNANGYPYIYDRDALAAGKKNGMVPGRVTVWRLSGETLLPGRQIAMSCRNRRCLARWHMLAVTYVEAQRLAVEAGSYKSMRRQIANVLTARKNSKLTRELVDGIKARVAAGEKRSLIAADMKLNRSTIDQIMRGVRWQADPLRITSATRITICKPMAQPTRSNTYASF